MGTLFSKMMTVCLGSGEQSILEQAVFAFFALLFLVALTLNFVGSKNRIQPASAAPVKTRRRLPLPRGDRSWKSVWNRCVWEFDVLKTYLQETANKYLGPAPAAEPVRLTQGVDRPPEAERRRWTRHPSDLRAIAWFSNQANAPSWLARVRDISEGGIGLVAPCRSTLGAIVELQLVSSQLVTQKPFKAEVMFVCPHSSAEWVLGCEFLDPLTPEQRRLCL
jgi:hypothetical protein